MGFVLLRLSILVGDKPWWGPAGRGSLGGLSPWQLRDKGHPCLLSSALRLAWVAQSSQHPRPHYKSCCVGSGEEILGK